MAEAGRLYPEGRQGTRRSRLCLRDECQGGSIRLPGGVPGRSRGQRSSDLKGEKRKIKAFFGVRRRGHSEAEDCERIGSGHFPETDLRRVGRLRPIEEGATLVCTLVGLCHLLHGGARAAGNLNNLFVPLFRGAGTSLHRVRYLFVQSCKSVTNPDRANITRVARDHGQPEEGGKAPLILW